MSSVDAGRAPQGLESTVWRVVLICGVAFAFSPTLLDLFEHMRENAWARASLAFPVLVWAASGRASSTRRRTSWGWIAVATGLLVELVAIAGGVVRIGRIGLTLAAAGLCLGWGSRSLRAVALFAWLVPVPNFIVSLMSPELESTWGRLAASAAGLLGAEVESDGAFLLAADTRFELLAVDGGLALVAMLAGLGWFTTLEMEASDVRSVALACGRYALGGLLLQLATICAVAIGLGAGLAPGDLRAALSAFPWIVIWSLALYLVASSMTDTRSREPRA